MAKIRIPGTRRWVEPDSEEAKALGTIAAEAMRTQMGDDAYDEKYDDEGNLRSQPIVGMFEPDSEEALALNNDPEILTAEEVTRRFTNVHTDEDWQDQAAGEQALASVLKAQVHELRAEIKAEIMAEIMAAQIASQSKPSLAMRANVHDVFMQGSNNNKVGGAVLTHWRCDEAKSVKMVELDMDLLEAYESGEKERPTNEKGRPQSPVSLAVIPGATIDWVDGHCYTYTENQNRNIERAKRRAEMGLSGGMAGIYEDTGASEQWFCYTCQPRRQFANAETWANHMRATHDVKSLVAA